MTELYEVWESLLAAGATPVLPCRAAREAQASSRNIVRMIAGAAPNARVAVEAARRYWPLVTDAYSFSITTDAASLQMTFDTIPTRMGARLDLVFTIASLTYYSRMFSDHAMGPFEILVAGPKRMWPWMSDVGLELDARVRFDCERDALRMEGDVHAPLPRSDPGLYAHLTGEADRALAGLPGVGSWVSRTWTGLGQLAGAPARLEDVARRLGTSPRTLRRRLAEAGTTYAALLEGWRSETARRLVAGWSDDALSKHLGFTDVRAFRRAFTRWTGVSPGAARRTARATWPDGSGVSKRG